MKIIEQVLKTIRNYEMLEPGDTVLVAVSGGPDSIFLLDALNGLKRKLGIKKLVVCNLDHGLRGKESAEDSSFVKAAAEKLGLEFIHEKINLADKKNKKISTEELAREERYKFFREAASKCKATVLATGHTLDDQAETIIMRFIKGSSLKGMAGVAPVRKEGNLRIIRPLLELEKTQITRYLDAKRISCRIDSSNLETKYFRNVARKEIVPFLERYNPRLKRALSNLAEHLREDLEFISEEKRRVKKSILCGNEAAVRIGLKDIVVQPKALQKEILRDLLEKAGGEIKKLSFRHWKEMDSLIRQKRKGNSLDLPGGIRITRTREALEFSRI